MTTTFREAPDAMLRRLAVLALGRAERARDTVERVRWQVRHNDLTHQAAEVAQAGDD